jgi:hypothetical protein
MPMNHTNRAKRDSKTSLIESLEPRRLLSADYVASLAFGGAGNEVIKHINVDYGQREVVGTFTGTCDFAPGKSQYLMTSRGGADVFVAAYSESGALLWARQLGGTGDDEAGGILRTSTGLVITGGFTGTADFNPTAGVDLRTSNGKEDAFVWNLSANGKLIWARTAGGPGNDVANDVAYVNGTLVSVGSFRNTVNFHTGRAAHLYTSNGNRDGFIWELALDNGRYQGFRQIGSIGDDSISAVTQAPGGIDVVGQFGGRAYLGFSTKVLLNEIDIPYTEGDIYITPRDAQDVFFATYDLGLHYSAHLENDGGGIDRATDIVTDPGVGTFIPMTSGNVGSRTLFIWTLGGGRYVPFRTTGDVVGGDIIIDNGGNVRFTATFSGNDIDGSGLISHGGTDILIGTIPADVTQPASFTSIGGPGNDVGNAVASLPRALSSSAPYALYGGSFRQSIDLDPNAGIVTRKSAGGDDAFFVQLLA